MPVALTYPGVYIEEIPSGVRTIVGVPTSVAAFIGRAVRGPVNDPTVINNFGDFERTFGGLGADYPMSYAVNDFFLNGGGQAVIVRLFLAAAAGATGVATLSPGVLNLVAATPGTWGNKLKATVDYKGITDAIAQRYDPAFTAADLFNLTVQDTRPNGQTEVFRNLSVKDGPRRVDHVLEDQSSLVRLARNAAGGPDLPPAIPADGANANGAGGADSAALTDAAIEGDENLKTGMFALKNASIFNLLCIPPDTRWGDISPAVYQAATAFCVKQRAMLIVDPRAAWSSNPSPAGTGTAELGTLGITGPGARNAALYFPRVLESDLLREGQIDTFVPCGIVAGIMARTDSDRGVWKAPAGLDAALVGVQGLEANLTDDENGELNPLGINCLRNFPITGRVVWGARTLRGADQEADEYKYVPVRRLALYIEESLYRGTKWVVFEPNDEPLWSEIRLNVGVFMHNLFRKGAFEGATPSEAYFVRCDKTTTTQADIDLGIVNIIVGFAPLKPAEFVVIQIQQIAGQLAA
jgi:Bacteriophage tail sheath protein